MVTADDNPLLAELAPEQLVLLEAVWKPIAWAAPTGAEAGWPTWDYAVGTLYQSCPSVRSGYEVLESLPRLRQATWTGNDYGLVWVSETTMSGIPPRARIGLTVAGMAQLARAKKLNPAIVDELIGVIENLAQRESKLVPAANGVVAEQVMLSEYTMWLTQANSQERSVPDAVIEATLRHEYPRLAFVTPGVLELGGHWLRPQLGVAGIEDYLGRLVDALEGLERSMLPATALTLVQTLDYLSLVIADAKVWASATRMVHAPDLESAATLMGDVRTKADFDQRMLALYSIVDHLKVPPIPEDHSPLDARERSRTLTALQHWLHEFLVDAESRDSIDQAIRDLRDALQLRHLAGHMNSETRARAAKAQKRLGLPAFISDWPAAWQILHARTAAAFDAIRREVQARGA